MKKILPFSVFLWIAVGAMSAVPRAPRQVLSDFLVREGARWAVQFSDHNTVVSLYGLGRSRSGSPDKAASRFLSQYSEMLGIPQTSDLRLRQKEQTLLGTHYRYQQYYAGLPVVSSGVNVHVNRSGQIIAANSRYFELQGSMASPQNHKAAAVTALRFLRGRGTLSNVRLMVLPVGSNPRLVWTYDAVSPDGRSWILYVDAANPHIIHRAVKTFMDFDGQGNVWMENPVATPKLVQGKFLHMDATKALSGQYAHVYDANFKLGILDTYAQSLSQFTTAKSPNRKYNYAKDDGRLAEAMAYYQFNRAHDVWRTFGFHGLDAPAPIFVNVAATQNGPGYDNAFYSRSPYFETGMYVFGSGRRYYNNAFDADVLLHEYGHGVLDHTVPQLSEAVESIYPLAFHEAFGDISSSAFSGNSRLAEYGFLNRQTGKWEGRNLDNNNSYPKNVVDPVKHTAERHYTSLIASGSWWDLQQQIGIPRAQSLLYQCLRLLPAEMNFFDLRDALIAADASLNNGAARTAITASFTKHGISGPNPGQKGKIQFKGFLVAGGPPGQNPQVKNSFQRGDIIFLIAQYDGAGLAPGYRLVPEVFVFQQPSGSDGSAFAMITDIANGPHRGLKGARLYAVDSDQTYQPGTYTFNLSARLGGTTQEIPVTTVSFTLN